MIEALSSPWPWYVGGPLIGLFVPAMLFFVGRPLGISSSFRDVCAATVPAGLDFLRYDWKGSLWRLAFVLGIVGGGYLAWNVLAAPEPVVAISEATRADLRALGIEDQSGLVPAGLLSWDALLTLPGLALLVGGGFLVGFGARYAGGCTSGHAISGLSDLQLASLLAVLGFFAGGLFSAHALLPLLLR